MAVMLRDHARSFRDEDYEMRQYFTSKIAFSGYYG